MEQLVLSLNLWRKWFKGKTLWTDCLTPWTEIPTHTPRSTVLSHGHLFSECLEHQASLECVRMPPPTGRLCTMTCVTQHSVKPAPVHPVAQMEIYIICSLFITKKNRYTAIMEQLPPQIFASGNISHSGSSQKQIWHSELSQWKPQWSADPEVQIRDSWYETTSVL